MSIDTIFDGSRSSARLGGVQVLLWRHWQPLYDPPATIASLSDQSIGGTDSQLLWHALSLVEAGARVQVLGVTNTSQMEYGIEYIGAANFQEQERCLESGEVRAPNVIFLEGNPEGAVWLKQRFPNAKTVHIGQNIDNGGYRRAFRHYHYIDAYALVGMGQFADYCVRFHQLRHKFLLLRNCVPWERVYSSVPLPAAENEIAWVGNWSKKGLRRWAVVMQRILSTHEELRWTLYGPRYGTADLGMPRDILHSLALPQGRVAIKSLPMTAAFAGLARATIVLTSLGNETASISALEAHAVGRPVISGNDLVYKYANPEGTGIRVTTAKECEFAVRRLLQDPPLCRDIGRRGAEFVRRSYLEKHQHEDLCNAVEYLMLTDRLGDLSKLQSRSRTYALIEDLILKVQRKANELGAMYNDLREKS